VDAGGGLLTAADDRVDQLRVVLVDRGDHIHPVVDGDRRLVVDHRLDGGVVVVVTDATDGVGGDRLAGVQCGAHVVVGRERVTAGDRDLGTAVRQQGDEVRGRRLDVHRHPDRLARERLRLAELLAQFGENRHVLAGPLDLLVAGVDGTLRVVEVPVDRRVRVCTHATTLAAGPLERAGADRRFD